MSSFQKRLRQVLARHRLQRMVDANKRAPSTIEFARRREAMLKITRPQERTG